ncbi:hypothetical protein BVC80_1823g20 [Macleaya cordata]|uniref:Uncharacterized protein n=1 Tax=Macleaya cordata TaxID=56857 RepID=A0A200QZS7_MACCD|nr:hypothetical protein BVC80_1823g20 [Macleaya cordata]
MDLLPNSEISSSLIITNNDELKPLSNGEVQFSKHFPSITYTSLRDMLPPPLSTGQSFHEIPIKNRLVKQAAWAYLQPMSNSPESDEHDRCLGNCVENQINGCFVFIKENVLRAFRGLFRGIFRQVHDNDDDQQQQQETVID